MIDTITKKKILIGNVFPCKHFSKCFESEQLVFRQLRWMRIFHLSQRNETPSSFISLNMPLTMFNTQKNIHRNSQQHFFLSNGLHKFVYKLKNTRQSANLFGFQLDRWNSVYFSFSCLKKNSKYVIHFPPSDSYLLSSPYASKQFHSGWFMFIHDSDEKSVSVVVD